MITNFSPGAQYLYNRAYSLAIGAPGQTSALLYSNFAVQGKSSAIQPPTSLRVRFDIEKNTFGTPNKAKIEVYNLADQTRNQIKKGWLVQLQVGYTRLVQTLFIGNIVPDGLKSVRNGPDIITTMECGDGESAITNATINTSYPPGTTLVQLIKDLANAMAVTSDANPNPVGGGVALGLPAVTYGRGITLVGLCRDKLTNLLKPLGLRWSVQNGNLTIIPVDGFDGSQPILLSKANGLIGTPSQNAQYMECQALLNPKLVPNGIIQLKSDNTALNGFYKILNGHYEGDSHDTKWNVNLQSTLIGSTQNLPASNVFNPQAVV